MPELARAAGIERKTRRRIVGYVGRKIMVGNRKIQIYQC
jgi:hypothetical protein